MKGQASSTLAEWGGRLRRRLLLILVALAIAPAAFGQSIAAPLKPKTMELFDANGVSLLGPDGSQDAATFGRIRLPEPAIAVGDSKAGGLSFQRTRTGTAPSVFGESPTNNTEIQLRSHNLLGTFSQNTPSLGNPYPWSVFSLGDWSSDPTLVVDAVASPAAAADIRRYGNGATTCSDGVRTCYYREDGAVLAYESAIWPLEPGAVSGRIMSLTKPDGEVITWHYNSIGSGFWSSLWRLQSVTNNLGYMIHFQYERNTSANADDAWRFLRPTKVTALDVSLNPCSPTAFSCSDSTGANWPYLLYAVEGTSVSTVTDRAGNVHRFYSQRKHQHDYGSVRHARRLSQPKCGER